MDHQWRWSNNEWQGGTGWNNNNAWENGTHSPGWPRPWSPAGAGSPAKDPSDWGKYTYLNGGPKATHTVPAEQRAWLIREMMSRVQQDDDTEEKVKIPVLKTLKWNVNTLDATIWLFCGIGRRMAIGSLGKSRDAVLVACVEGFLNKYPEPEERQKIMLKVLDNADSENSLLEMAVEDGFNYEPDPAPARPAIATPRAGSGFLQQGLPQPPTCSQPTRGLTRHSTEEVIAELEKRRKIADMEKDAAIAESAAMAARHAAANGRMWQAQAQAATAATPTQATAAATPAQATAAAPPGGALAAVDSALFGTPRARAATPGAQVAPGVQAAADAPEAHADLGGQAAQQPLQPTTVQPPAAVAGHGAEEQAKQDAIRARQRLLATAESSATGEQALSSMRKQDVDAQAMEERLAKQGKELEAMEGRVSKLSEELGEAQKQEQEAMHVLGEARVENDAIRSRLQSLENSEKGEEVQAMAEKVSKLSEELNLMRIREEEASHRQHEAQAGEQKAMRLREEAKMEEDAFRSQAQKASQDAKLQQEMDASRHLAEMKDLQLQAMSFKAEVTQLRTELQNAQREASLHSEMHTLQMQAEEAKVSALQAELGEAKGESD